MEQVQKRLAKRGNFQDIRTNYFAWRELIKEGKLSVHKLNEKDKMTLGDMRYRATWEGTEVFLLMAILRKYKDDLRKHGIIIEQDPKTRTTTQGPIPRQKLITYSDNKFKITFPYDKRIVAMIKSQIAGNDRSYDNYTWSINPSQSDIIIRIAEIYDFKIGDRAKQILYKGKSNFEQSYSCERVELELPLLKRLYDYQTVGVDYHRRLLRSWNADQMGLGKTPQGIATAVAVNKWPVLIICPKSLRENWKREIHEWTNYKAMVATHKNIPKLASFIEHDFCHFLIVNYDGVKTFFVDQIVEHGRGKKIIPSRAVKLFKGFIIDESHELRNSKTTRYKCIKKCTEHMQFKLLLTGSPIVNTLDDVRSQLDLIGRLESDFGGYSGFNKEFKKRGSSKWEKDVDRNMNLLNRKLRSTCMIRREKHQVLHELPDKFRTVVEVDIANRKEYDHAYISLQSYLTSKNVDPAKISQSMNAELLVKLSLLKRLSAAGKISAMAEVAESMLNAGEKIIIFCWFKETIDLVKKSLNCNVLEISGRINDDHKIEYNKRLFQEDPNYPVICITYKKGGTGHTLTAASNVFFIEPAWTGADHDQAEDRAHRIGQKQNVNCHYFMGKNTIDKHIYSIINRKRQLSRESTDSREQIQTSVVGELTKIIIDENN